MRVDRNLSTVWEEVSVRGKSFMIRYPRVRRRLVGAPSEGFGHMSGTENLLLLCGACLVVFGSIQGGVTSLSRLRNSSKRMGACPRWFLHPCPRALSWTMIATTPSTKSPRSRFSLFPLSLPYFGWSVSCHVREFPMASRSSGRLTNSSSGVSSCFVIWRNRSDLIPSEWTPFDELVARRGSQRER